MSELSSKQRRLSNTDEVTNLDVLRAAAVSSVFFAHLYNFIHPGYSQAAWHFGQLGVLMFFVHTSLVLMYSLQRQDNDALPLFSAFYIRRWFRLYPLSIAFVTVVYVTSLWRPEWTLHWTLADFFANISLTQNLLRRPDMISVLWTLPLEVQMYLTLPFFYMFLRGKSWFWVVVLLLTSIPFAFISIFVTDRLSVLGYIPCFLGGVLAWKLSRQYQPILPSWLWPVALAIVSLIWFRAENLSPYQMYLRWVFCVILGAVIPMFRPLENDVFTRFAALIAKYSYGIYLSHLLILSIAFHILATKPKIVQWGVFALLMVAVPVVAYKAIEAPMIRFGRRWQGFSRRSIVEVPAIQREFKKSYPIG